jgi:hypothetical protein
MLDLHITSLAFLPIKLYCFNVAGHPEIFSVEQANGGKNTPGLFKMRTMPWHTPAMMAVSQKRRKK